MRGMRGGSFRSLCRRSELSYYSFSDMCRQIRVTIANRMANPVEEGPVAYNGPGGLHEVPFLSMRVLGRDFFGRGFSRNTFLLVR